MKTRMDWITVEDIAEKLWWQKQFWFHGPPKIRVEGEEGRIGRLVFEFGDTTIRIGVYLQDKQEIEDRANIAVLNFDKIISDKLQREREL